MMMMLPCRDLGVFSQVCCRPVLCCKDGCNRLLLVASATAQPPSLCNDSLRSSVALSAPSPTLL